MGNLTLKGTLKAFIAGFICISSCTFVNAVELYKWVDADGNTQYTQQPPLKTGGHSSRKKSVKKMVLADKEHAGISSNSPCNPRNGGGFSFATEDGGEINTHDDSIPDCPE